MLRAFVAAVVAIAVTACTAPAPPEQPASQAAFIGIEGKPLVSNGVIDASVQEALTADPAACAKAGGELKPVCRMQRPMCLITFSDAGRSCTDGAQCGSGRCLAESPTASTGGGPGATGQCSTTNDPCGCYQRIEKGVAQPTLCAD